jgi:hypothetical protein
MDHAAKLDVSRITHEAGYTLLDALLRSRSREM